MTRFDPTYERCRFCMEYYIPTLKEQEAHADKGYEWTCPACLRVLAHAEAKPFNMDYDYQAMMEKDCEHIVDVPPIYDHVWKKEEA